jgi:hypothetical protein
MHILTSLHSALGTDTTDTRFVVVCTGPYAEPDESTPYPQTVNIGSTLLLSSLLRLFLRVLISVRFSFCISFHFWEIKRFKIIVIKVRNTVQKISKK